MKSAQNWTLWLPFCQRPEKFLFTGSEIKAPSKKSLFVPSSSHSSATVSRISKKLKKLCSGDPTWSEKCHWVLLKKCRSASRAHLRLKCSLVACCFNRENQAIAESLEKSTYSQFHQIPFLPVFYALEENLTIIF